MRLTEISDEQKSFLTLQGIKFDFLTEYQNIVSAISLIGKSSHRSTLLGSDIDYLMSDILLFLNQGFDENDSDVISANKLYAMLLAIKIQL